MVPIIYTTYGVAMGHRPETLASSGGLRPAGKAGRAEVTPALVLLSRARRWLKTLVVHVSGGHRNAVGRTEDSKEATRLSERLRRPSGAAAITALTRTATPRAGGDHA